MIYADFTPSPMDGHIILEDQEDWLVAPVSRNRDSQPLEESNFKYVEDLLEELEIEFQTHRFGHWANGWFEVILVDPDHELAEGTLEEIQRSLDDYPILNEDDLSEREYKAAEDSWLYWGFGEAKEAVQEDLPVGLDEDFEEDEDQYLIDRGIVPEVFEDSLWEVTDFETTGEGPAFLTPDTKRLFELHPELLWPADEVNQRKSEALTPTFPEML